MQRTAHRLRLVRLLYLLRHKQVRSAYSTALQLNCSIRTFYHYLARLKRDGFKIKYSKTLGRYIIEEDT